MAAHVDPDNLQSGTLVGVYTVVRRIGAGGFGTLYQVERDGKHYALKLSRERLGSLTPEKRKRFEDRTDREVAALKSLRHPNIVSIYAVDRWPELETGYPFLVIEFVEGERLDGWCRSSSPSLLRICEAFEKIGRAVHYMHERQLFHRDLKSENVLVRSDGEPVLIDFGIARARASYRVTRQLDVVGTSTHYAPEYLEHVYSEAFERGVDFEWTAATDLHAVGYMLYELLAGRPPFSGDSEPEIWRAIQTVVPRAPSLVNPRAPGALDNVVLKLLEKDPRDRYQSGAELAEAIQRIREDRAADPAWTGPFDIPTEMPGAVVTTAARPRGPRARGDEGEIEPIRSSTESKRPTSDVDHFLSTTPLMQALEKGARPGAAPAGPVVDDVPFAPPTVVKPLFVPPGAEAAARIPPPSPNAPPTVPSVIRRVKEQIERGDKAKSKKLPIPATIGLALAVFLLAFFAVVGRTGQAERNPSSLIERVKKESATSGTAAQADSAPPPATAVTNISLPPPPSPPRPPVSAPAAPPTSAPSAADARSIDRELVAHYGGRPTVPSTADHPADGGVEAGAAQEPAWMRRSQPLHAPARVARTNAPLGIPTGAHIPVRLLTTLDSRTVGNGPVEAKLSRPFVVRGEVVLAAGTLLFGQASATDGRFTIRFAKLRLPDDRELDFAGLAMDREDGKPGLAASRRSAADPVQGEGLGTAIAKNTAGVLLNTVTGGVAQDVARGAGQTALNHQDATAAGRGDTQLLDPGVLFDVWVERAF
ncbi:protein kinase domain-containing protein [Anaeromyxobacter oryzisoli]|uniref:protein kinase domain-containing protein n=1 Tax=Anaeromyxobacter oryzisoli TaxID=2925408 RepID=UPI001F55D2CF|nr:protein kinase [Anaeromyxobacter sp. SG63]